MRWYEYKSLVIELDVKLYGKIKSFESIDTQLNAYGAEGWELVNFAMGDTWSGNEKSVFVILKRAAGQ